MGINLDFSATTLTSLFAVVGLLLSQFNNVVEFIKKFSVDTRRFVRVCSYDLDFDNISIPEEFYLCTSIKKLKKKSRKVPTWYLMNGSEGKRFIQTFDYHIGNRYIGELDFIQYSSKMYEKLMSDLKASDYYV